MAHREHPSEHPHKPRMNWITLTVVAGAAALLLYYVAASLMGLMDGHEAGRTATATAPRTAPEPETPAAVTAAAEGEEGAAVEADAVDGKAVYTRVCAACHQASGQGVPNAFPPLAASDWVSGDPAVPIKVVLKGLAGPVVVNGQKYNNAMPGWAATLSDAEVAAVLTYVRQSWGNGADPVNPPQVSALRKELASRSAPFSADELR